MVELFSDKARVVEVCEAFRVLGEAYYRSSNRPRVVDAHPAWGVRKLWAYLRGEGLIGSPKGWPRVSPRPWGTGTVGIASHTGL